MNCVIPTGIGFLSTELIIVRAIVNSFQAATNVKMTAVTSPGNAIGIVTFLNACNLVQPSISAASSISTGMLAKKPDNSQTEKAKLNPAFKIISLKSKCLKIHNPKSIFFWLKLCD